MTNDRRLFLDLQITPNTWNEYANGYLASCESNLLTVSVEHIRSSTAQVAVTVPKQLFYRPGGKTDYLRRPFLSVYYKATRSKNETHFDATQSHKWLRIVEKANYNPTPQGKIVDRTKTISLINSLSSL